jgi:hypothetical protein
MESESNEVQLYCLPIAEVMASEKLSSKLLSLVSKCKIKSNISGKSKAY